MATVRIGSISVAFSAETGEFSGDVRKAQKAMQFLNQESKRTGETLGQTARRTGILDRQFKSLQRSSNIARNQSRALRR